MTESERLLLVTWSESWKALLVVLPAFCNVFILSTMATIFFRWKIKIRISYSWPVFAGFGLFGSTVGLFIGQSDISSLNIALPPVISLAASYIVISKTDRFSTKIRLIVPAAIGIMLLSLILSSFYMQGFTGGGQNK